MATPFLAVLRERFPDDLITAVSRGYVSELLRRCSFLDRLITYERKDGVRGAVHALRAERPVNGWEAALVLPMSFSSALAAFMSRAKRRIGYDCCWRRPLLTDTIEKAERGSIHLSREYAVLAEVLGGGTFDVLPRPSIVPPYDWRERVARYGLEPPYAVLSAGAAYGPAKIWPRSGFSGLAAMLREKCGLRVVVAGSADEREYLEGILISIGGGGLNLAGRTDMGGMMSLLRGADIVVGNDSGPVHVSAAMGVPTVAIFGSTSPAWTSPAGPHIRIVTADLDCSPCFRKTCPEGDPRCLTGIGAHEVFEAAVEIMREKKGE